MFKQVWLVFPPGYVHSAGLLEIVKAFTAAFNELQCSVTSPCCLVTRLEDVNWQVKTLVFGAHLLTAPLPAGFVIYNSEQVDEKSPWLGGSYYLGLLRKHEVWDYSPLNVRTLHAMGIEAELVPIGYHESMECIRKTAETDGPADPTTPISQDIPILFYGSINDRRQKILDDIGGVTVTFNCYGTRRDTLIARSKIVLNLHYYDAKIFEIFRVAHLLANEVCVVSEFGRDTALEAPFEDGICFADDIPIACDRLLGDSYERESLAQRGYEIFKSKPLIESLRGVM